MGKGSWLAVLGVLSFGGAMAQAQDQERGKMFITPFVGSTHLRIDSGQVYNESQTFRVDSLQTGVRLGYRAPFGLVVEVGRSSAVHANLFDDHGDYWLTQGFGAIGWRVEFADGWHITPRVGRESWELSSDRRVFPDDAGVRHTSIDGWQNFWEVGLTRDVKSWLSLGVNFKDVNEDFGHSRTGEFTASFQF